MGLASICFRVWLLLRGCDGELLECGQTRAWEHQLTIDQLAVSSRLPVFN